MSNSFQVRYISLFSEPTNMHCQENVFKKKEKATSSILLELVTTRQLSANLQTMRKWQSKDNQKSSFLESNPTTLSHCLFHCLSGDHIAKKIYLCPRPVTVGYLCSMFMSPWWRDYMDFQGGRRVSGIESWSRKLSNHRWGQLWDCMKPLHPDTTRLMVQSEIDNNFHVSVTWLCFRESQRRKTLLRR